MSKANCLKTRCASTTRGAGSSPRVTTHVCPRCGTEMVFQYAHNLDVSSKLPAFLGQSYYLCPNCRNMEPVRTRRGAAVKA